MSIQPTNSFSQSNIYKYIKNYVIPPFAAGASIIPLFRLFVYKSAEQAGKIKPNMPTIKWMQEGVKASPTIGFIVGSQIIIQRIVEQILFNKEEQQKDTFSKIFLSSMIVGALSAPSLAAFNAQTMKKPIIQSIKELSKKQLGAIMAREAGFLFSIRVSDPVSDTVREKLGNNPAAIYTAVFIGGVIGALCSHPADTYLTALQANVKVKSLKDYMKGSFHRSVAVGLYSVLYKIFKECLENRV